MIKYCYTLKDLIKGSIGAPNYNLYSTNKQDDSDIPFISAINRGLGKFQTIPPGQGHMPQAHTLYTTRVAMGLSIDDFLPIKLNTLPDEEYIVHTPMTRLFLLIYQRFGEDYIYKSESDTFTFKSDELQHFCEKFLSVLYQTKEKYYSLLSIYENNLDKLMNPLKTTHLGSGNTARHENYDTDVAGKNIFNDVPESTEVVSDLESNQFATEVSKSTAHTDNVGDISEARQEASSTEVDTLTTMAKIKEIQESYQMTLKKWSDEFEPLFIEEV